MVESQSKQELNKLRNQLYLCLKYAYQGSLNLEKLYQKGDDITMKLGSNSGKLMLEDGYDVSALEFVSELHDSSTRKSLNKEQLYYHLVSLNKNNNPKKLHSHSFRFFEN